MSSPVDPTRESDAAASASRSDERVTEGGPEKYTVEEHIETLRLRRSPKYSVFLVAGAGLGVLAAMILTFAFNGTGDMSPNTGMVYSSGQVFGFLALICITAGVVLGGLTALLLDRMLARRSRDVVVDRESVRADD
jgi:hypothetical protein